MQISIESPGLPTPVQWRASMEERVRFVMRRLRSEIMHIRVRLHDVNGPRGGVDQQCQVSVVTEGHGVVVVRSTGADPLRALDAALQRASYALVRSWQRRRRQSRMAARPAAFISQEIQAE